LGQFEELLGEFVALLERAADELQSLLVGEGNTAAGGDLVFLEQCLVLLRRGGRLVLPFALGHRQAGHQDQDCPSDWSHGHLSDPPSFPRSSPVPSATFSRLSPPPGSVFPGPRPWPWHPARRATCTGSRPCDR